MHSFCTALRLVFSYFLHSCYRLAEIEKDAKRTHALASQVDRHSGANGAVSTQPLLCLVWLVLGECKDLLIEHDYNWVHTQYAITNK